MPEYPFMHVDEQKAPQATGCWHSARARLLTVQARRSFIYHTLLRVGVFDRWIIIRNKIGLQRTKTRLCVRQAHTGYSLSKMLTKEHLAA